MKGFDVREEFMSESQRLLARIDERRNLAVCHALFQIFELGQVLVDFKQRLGVGNSTSCGSDESR